jgi:hypothetical protein
MCASPVLAIEEIASSMSPAQRRRAAHSYRRRASTFATVILSAGLVFALAGAIGCWRGYVVKSWPTATATLVSNTLEKTEETRTIPMTDRLRGGIQETIKTETLALAYRYSVDGMTFEGHKLETWDFGLPGKAKAREIAALGIGGIHPVSYDPRDPRRAYLTAGPSTTSRTLVMLGLVLMAAGFVMGRILRRA